MTGVTDKRTATGRRGTGGAGELQALEIEDHLVDNENAPRQRSPTKYCTGSGG